MDVERALGTAFNLLDAAFRSKACQKITSIGPLAPLVKPKKVVESIVQMANDVIVQVIEGQPVAINLHVINWTRATNGVAQGIAFCLISLVSSRIFLTRKGAAVGLLIGFCWMGIAVKHLACYNVDQHANFYKGSKLSWK